MKRQMMDLLYSAAVKYGKLLTIGYHIILGRKGKEYHIQLRFPYDSFFHLIGLQHLTDLTYPSKNKERIYKEIIGENLTYGTISKSQYFEEFYIKERIEYLDCLENMLDSCELIFLINPKEYAKHTKIKANFLFEHDFMLNEPITLYLFLVKKTSPKICNECKGCSFFRKHEIDFRRGTSQTTILLVEKYKNVDTIDQEGEVLFRNPSYREGQGIIQK
jgi:hypothetical protein